MSRIDGSVTELAPHRTGGTHGAVVCWVCQSPVSARTAFCPTCTAIQPPRALDHFVRLGLECRFDLDRRELDERYRAVRRVFAVERFAAQGVRQRQLALDHLAAVEEAYLVLRDPVRRAEYLLTLVEEPGLTPTVTANSNDLDVLCAQLQAARDVAAVDRVASLAGRGVEACLLDLSASFRHQAFTEVAVVLARLSRLEDIGTEARERRADLVQQDATV